MNLYVFLWQWYQAHYDERYPTDGFVWGKSFARIAVITDGLSNTVMLSESLKGDKIVSTGPFTLRFTLPMQGTGEASRTKPS